MKRYLPIILAVLLVGALGGTGWFWHVSEGLQEELSQVRDKLARTETNNDALQQRHKEQQSRITWLEQSRRSLEAQAGQEQQVVQALKHDLEVLVKDYEVLRQEATEKLATLTSALKERHELANKQMAEAKDKLREAAEAIAAQKAEIAKLTAAGKMLEANLAQQTEGFGRCRENNGAMAGLAKEVLQLYYDKSVSDVLAQREPLTQIKRARMQSLIEEYAAKIREQTLQKQQ